MMDDRPGERFSQVYGVRGEPTADSARMRHRIGGAIASMPQLQNNLRGIVDKEIGVSAPATQTWMSIVKEMALSDLLDLMTVAADYLRIGTVQYGTNGLGRSTEFSAKKMYIIGLSARGACAFILTKRLH